MVFLQYLMRIYSTLLINQKFLKANIGFIANDVSNFITLFIIIITVYQNHIYIYILGVRTSTYLG